MRGPGVHTSKVRSLTLDKLSGPQLLILQGLGNQLSRGVWEAINTQVGQPGEYWTCKYPFICEYRSRW